MTEWFKEYIDEIISDVIRYDYDFNLTYKDYYDKIFINEVDNPYYKDDLKQIDICGIIDEDNDVLFKTVILRTSDYDNLQNVINYILKKLNQYNDEKRNKSEYTDFQIKTF